MAPRWHKGEAQAPERTDSRQGWQLGCDSEHLLSLQVRRRSQVAARAGLAGRYTPLLPCKALREEGVFDQGRRKGKKLMTIREQGI